MACELIIQDQKPDEKSSENWDQIWVIKKSEISDSGKPSQVLSVWINRWHRVESEYQSSRTSQSRSSQLADWWSYYTVPV
jgi:hypothetical protein